jgi:hypothetical protein
MGAQAKSARQVSLPGGTIGIEFFDADGNKLATHVGGDKPWRNNNPGNLKGGKGAIGHDERDFAIFPDVETGLKAKADLLRQDKRYQGLTIKEMVPIYAPAKDGNDVPRYTKDIGNFSGLEVNRRLDSLSDEEYQRLMQAISVARVPSTSMAIRVDREQSLTIRARMRPPHRLRIKVPGHQ